jgi:hypothetical protein
MTHLDLFSEPFAKTGSLSAEGFRRLLGRPALGLLQTVLRESVQNSIDAAKNGRGPRILIRLRTLTSEQRAILSDHVLTSLPSNAESDRLLSKFLKSDRPRVMEIADFHTTGLAGPTRADIPSDNGEDPDFVNFMRNVGAARDTHQGGGTYGFGKTSLYAMSGCSTIIVDSETTNGGNPVRRFMGCHLGAAFDATGADGVRRRFTGRHWWGVADGDANVEPAEEDAARLLGSRLDMPVRDRGQTGTTIMILDPQLTAEELPEIRQELIETILWNFWPRMTGTTPARRKLSVDLEVDGQLVLVPPPEQFPPLDLFAAAISDHRVNSDDLTPIRSQRPTRHLGNLAIRRGARAERVGFTESRSGLIPQQCSHIALMRPVELVVRYIAGEAFPDKRFEWAGVFICSGDDEVEQAFASAEPPAHDDWMPDNLPKGPAKTFVNVALNRLNEIARTHVNPQSGAAVTGERGPSLARTATKMGRLLEAVSGQGPGRRSAPGSGSTKRRMTAVSQPEFIRLSLGEGGKPVAWFEANLTNDGSDPSLRIIAEPHLVADGGATGTDDLPAEYSVAASYLEIDPAGPAVDGHALEVGTASGRVRVAVPMPGDAAVGLRLRLIGEAHG